MTVLALLNGCASTTVIRTTSPNAKIYVDGEYKGVGTVSHTDQKTIGATTHVRIQEEGCQAETFSFSRNEEFDVGACIGGWFLLIPWLWVMRYKPERTYEYRCQPQPAAPNPAL
ncbi:MAG TPA: PEGA domain-containing protein [Myxococcaceae bacterium]|nr:PEGA domain-containing protein [Myxococcaceae bacterium]